MSAIPSRRVVRPFAIGVVVLLATALTIAGALWLGASKWFEEFTFYATYFDGSVQGLEKGSPVKFQGIPVGNVQEIGLAPDGRMIEIVLAVKADMKITDSMRVKAELSSIAGGKFMQLYYPESAVVMGMHPTLDFTSEYPIIKSSPSGLQELEIALEELVNNLKNINTQAISDETVTFLRSSSAFLNNRDIGLALEHLAKSSVTMERILSRADTAGILANASETSRNLLEASERINAMAASLERQVQGLDLNYKMADAFARYDSLMINTTKAVSTLSFRTESVMIGVAESMSELQAASRQLRKSLRAFSESPSQTLLSEPPPREDQ